MRARSSSPVSCGASRSSTSLARFLLAWSAWKPAEPLIIGLVKISKLGHHVRLMPPSYVKGYVKRSKNDAADAAAICEAVTRPSMRFVPIKPADQQALLMLHRTRDLLIRQRTQLINALRAHLAESGLVAETGREGLAQLAEIITDESNREALPSAMKQALQAIVDQLAALDLQIGALDRAIHAHHRANDMSCRIQTVRRDRGHGHRFYCHRPE